MTKYILLFYLLSRVLIACGFIVCI